MDENKKSGAGGARDISDLKARLGLKKGAAGAHAGDGSAGAIPAPVPAPPGFGAPGGGDAEAPGPSEGAVEGAADAGPSHDPRRDPFGGDAMQAPPAGYYGYGIPGVDDGKPVEQLNKPQPLGRMALFAVAALALVASSFTLGKIQWARANMNRTIDQAADIKVEVDRMSKVLAQVNEKVASSPEAAKNNPDTQLAADLAGLDLKKPDNDKIFKTNYYYLDDLSVDLLFNYYNDTILLYALIGNHGKKTDADKEAIENFIKSAKAGDKNYGVTVDISGTIPLAHLAEIGGPVCPTEGDTNCSAADLKGFKFRGEPGGAWSTRPVKGTPGQVIFPLQKTPLAAQVLSGNPDILAAKDALRRQNDIRNLAVKMIGEQKELLAKLDSASDRKRKVAEYIVF